MRLLGYLVYLPGRRRRLCRLRLSRASLVYRDNGHIGPHAELPTPPTHLGAEKNGPGPDGEGQTLAAQPGEVPLAERAVLSAATGRSAREGRGVLVDVDASARMQAAKHNTVREHPGGDAADPAEPEGGPGLGDAEGLADARDGS